MNDTAVIESAAKVAEQALGCSEQSVFDALGMIVGQTKNDDLSVSVSEVPGVRAECILTVQGLKRDSTTGLAPSGPGGKAVYDDYMSQFGAELKENFCGWYESSGLSEGKPNWTTLLKLAGAVFATLNVVGGVVVLAGITITVSTSAIAAMGAAVGLIVALVAQAGLNVFCGLVEQPATTKMDTQGA